MAVHYAWAQEQGAAKEAVTDSWFTLNQDIKDKLDTYHFLPTNLSQWSYGDFGSITFIGESARGDFKTVDDFTETDLFSFKSESVQSFMESGWRFYGDFTFSISSDRDAEWNQFYKKQDTGSPLRFITRRKGDWNSKHYGLNGAMTKMLGDRLSLGAKIIYSGDMYSRLSDTRNEQYNLSLDIIGSVGYLIRQDKSVSLGLAYKYRKMQPSFSNDFKATGEEYNIYSIFGMGNFNDAMISDKVWVTDKNPEFILSYIGGSRNVFSLDYSFYPGRELWRNVVTSLNSTTPEERYRYDYYDNRINASYLFKKPGYELTGRIKLRYTSGTAYENRETFQRTFISDQLITEFSFALLRPSGSFLYKTDLLVNLESIDKKDLIYAQKIQYTNIGAGIKSGHRLNINQKNRLILDISSYYKINLDYVHDVASAGSMPYTLNIAYNEVAYYSSDYLQLGTGIRWQRVLRKVFPELALEYSYREPVKVRYTNDYSIVNLNSNKNYLKATINLYF